MWISRADFVKLIERNAELVAENREKAATLAALQTTLDWARVRLSQTEHERAQLLFNYTGVKIATPTIEPIASGPSIEDIMRQGPSFEDVGDAEARKLGIGWDDGGRLISRNQE